MMFRVIWRTKGWQSQTHLSKKGVAERMNRTLAEAFSTAAYLRNRLPWDGDKREWNSLCGMVMARNFLNQMFSHLSRAVPIALGNFCRWQQLFAVLTTSSNFCLSEQFLRKIWCGAILTKKFRVDWYGTGFIYQLEVPRFESYPRLHDLKLLVLELSSTLYSSSL